MSIPPPHSPQLAAKPPANAREFARDPLSNLDPSRFDRVQIWLVIVLLIIALGMGALQGIPYLTSAFLREQDLAIAAIVIVGGFLAVRQSGTIAGRTIAGRTGPVGFSGAQKIMILAAIVLIIGIAGQTLVFQDYPLSLDEFWAVADAEIFARGAPMARLADEWRDYGEALQPIFTRLQAEEGVWASAYLPLNAVLQMAAWGMASPVMAAGAIVLIADTARRLFPDQPQAPWIAALFLATSSQFLITAMTPYSMTAHLFFDLLWLWLFIQRRPFAVLLSLPVALFAMGLHQAAYFPLFAMPFLLERFLAGQRLYAVTYSAFILAGFVAWGAYEQFAFGWMGVPPPTGDDSGSARMVANLIERLGGFGTEAPAMMGANLARFVLWQNPLVPVLVVLAAWPIAKLASGAPRELRAMLLTLVGTTLFMLFVIPYQGHGWGYRYLHGQMGGAALIATFAYGRAVAGGQAQRWRGLFIAITALAILLLPIRAWQAHQFTAPYASAHAALGKQRDFDVIVIDAPGHAYTIDLTRNDPWLEHPVKRMAAQNLTDQQLARLCARYRVGFFRNADAARFGIRELPEGLQRAPRFATGCNT